MPMIKYQKDQSNCEKKKIVTTDEKRQGQRRRHKYHV
jgi:hypothetical protein